MIDKYKMPVLVYSRVSGYFNPVANFNKGKKSEFAERKTVNMEKINQRLSISAARSAY